MRFISLQRSWESTMVASVIGDEQRVSCVKDGMDPSKSYMREAEKVGF